jgi:phosphoenolpyruvate phosphomutase
VKKTAQLKALLTSERLELLLEAHNGISARLVEEAGFPGIWGSGLSLSASLGVRDCNEASWTQLLEMLDFMSDATSVPILFDADTGFGNFNNVRRLVRKLEQRGIAGMCIEDKLFPKSNSLLEGAEQVLEHPAIFAGKIKAAKDTQADRDFCVVARIESFIAGVGLEDALERAHAYAQAGADAILIHSKKPTADEVLSFRKAFELPVPLVVVPTTYHTTPAEVLEKAGFSVVICANHMLRSCITAMQRTAQAIRANRGGTSGLDIAPVAEVFRLQNNAELDQAERKYAPALKRP